MNGEQALASSLDRICTAISEDGYAVEAGFVPCSEVAALATDALRRDGAGEFRPAAVGRGRTLRQSDSVRGDRIAWLDPTGAEAASRPWWEALERLRVALNRTLYLGLFSFEGHYAIYPPGARYRRHRDRFKDDAQRVVSCVLYLNALWGLSDGGALRIYGDQWMRDILPVGGTLVCFLSDKFEHEVLPAARDRLALTGWFRRRS